MHGFLLVLVRIRFLRPDDMPLTPTKVGRRLWWDYVFSVVVFNNSIATIGDIILLHSLTNLVIIDNKTVHIVLFHEIFHIIFIIVLLVSFLSTSLNSFIIQHFFVIFFLRRSIP